MRPKKPSSIASTTTVAVAGEEKNNDNVANVPKISIEK